VLTSTVDDSDVEEIGEPGCGSVKLRVASYESSLRRIKLSLGKINSGKPGRVQGTGATDAEEELREREEERNTELNQLGSRRYQLAIADYQS